MAIRFTLKSTRSARSLLVIAALSVGGLITPALAGASPHAAPHADPSISDVQKQLGKLAQKNSQLVEKYNQARVLVGKRDKAAQAAQAEARKAEATYQRASVEFTQSIQVQYESGGLGAADALFDSNSGTNYVDRLNTMDLLSAHDAAVVKQVATTRKAAKADAKHAQDLLADAKQQRKAVASKKDDVEKQINKYKDLLDQLNAKAREAFQHRSQPVTNVHEAQDLQKQNQAHDQKTPHAAPAPSKGAQAAVAFALKQVGKPYVFGADGPGSYDCSGLTMRSWQHGGKSLPHSAAGQYGYGHHVDRSDLQPGDLIFFYQPIGHVTIYIGNGMMVSAPTEGEPVQVVSLDHFNSDYTGATRLT